MHDKLMIVAHPDDETIFGGAALLREKGWKVICVTNRYNPVRKKEFKKAMKSFRAKYEIWGYPDRRNGGFRAKESLVKKIRRRLRRRKYKKIVTHGKSGEYGHPQHRGLARILYKLADKNLYTFSRSDKALNRKWLRKKLYVLKVYKSQRYFTKKLKPYIYFEGIRKVK